jgi:hypothetical protein
MFCTKNTKQKISGWGFIYGVVMLVVFMNGSQYGFIENLKNSSFFEILVVISVFWLYGSFSISIYLYQFYFSKNYTEFFKRLIKIFVIGTIFVFTSEIFNFYWISIREYSKLSSHISSGLFFSPIFIGLTLIVQKIFLYMKQGYEISYPKNNQEMNHQTKRDEIKINRNDWKKVGNREGLYCYYCTKKLHLESWKNIENYYCDECYEKLSN